MSEKLELDQSIARAVSREYPDAFYIGVSDIDSNEIFFHAEGRLPTGNYTVVFLRHHDIIRAADGKYLIFNDHMNHWLFLTPRDFNTPDDAKRFLGCHNDEAPTKSNPSETSVPDTPEPIPSPSPKKIRRARFLTPWQNKTIDRLESKDISDDYCTFVVSMYFLLLLIVSFSAIVLFVIFLPESAKAVSPSVSYESAMSEWESTVSAEKSSAPVRQEGGVR